MANHNTIVHRYITYPITFNFIRIQIYFATIHKEPYHETQLKIEFLNFIREFFFRLIVVGSYIVPWRAAV